MRQPAYPVVVPTGRGIASGVPMVGAVFWQWQPQDIGPAAPEPVGVLPVVRGTYTDDASRPVQHQITLDLAYAPSGLEVGNWIQITLGLRGRAPQIYVLPAMFVTEIRRNNSRQGGATISASDPAEVLNGKAFYDTTLTGTLRDLVNGVVSGLMKRVTDVSGVPTIPVPQGTIAEFGEPYWDVCLKVADALGVVLHISDNGDVTGRMRADPPPQPITTIERVLVPPGGQLIAARYPTDAVVMVSRGSDLPPIYGSASTPGYPTWYHEHEVTERRQGDAATTQAAANQLARDLLNARRGAENVYENVAILPAPWLESGLDTVSADGETLWVRALSMELPSIAMNVTLRKAVTE